jgi:hypothetical protein
MNQQSQGSGHEILNVLITPLTRPSATLSPRVRHWYLHKSAWRSFSM